MAAEKIQLEHRLLGLKRYDAMLVAIAECHRVDEVKEMRDKARALEVYAAQAVNYEAEYRATEIRIRAERRAGELLKEQAETGQRAKSGGESKRPKESQRPILSDYGITPDQSSDWQKLAEIPEEEFETAVRLPGASTEGILRRYAQRQAERDGQSIKNIEPPSFDSGALFVWGSLRQYVLEEKYQGKPIIEVDPKQIISRMQRADWRARKQIVDWAPLVAAWLTKFAQEAKEDEEQ